MLEVVKKRIVGGPTVFFIFLLLRAQIFSLFLWRGPQLLKKKKKTYEGPTESYCPAIKRKKTKAGHV